MKFNNCTFLLVISCMKTHHYQMNLVLGIVHTSRANALINEHQLKREIKMEIMIILTLGLLAVVAMNEFTDH